MIALPIIPNAHTGLKAVLICPATDEHAGFQSKLPVIAWDSNGCALVPSHMIGCSAGDDHGKLVPVHRYAELMRDGYDDGWRFIELEGPA